MIRWAFLDVGNVLLDEDPLTFANFRVHVEAVRRVRPDLSFREILLAREERALAGSRWPLYEVVSQHLDDAGCLAAWEAACLEIRTHHDALSPTIVGAWDLIETLGRSFRLGLIANQGGDCRRRLDRLGWLDRFEVVAFGEEVGASKPDPALFRHALDVAGVEPGEALMIGDRLDNDVEPAAKLGMATARVAWPRRSAKGWSPLDAEGLAYLHSLERIDDQMRARPDRVRPTIEVDDLSGLIEACESGNLGGCLK